MGHSIFICIPPKDDGFSKQGGFGFFLPRSPQNFDHSDKFFKGTDKKRTRVQVPVIFRRLQIKNGTSQWTVVNNMAECSKKTSYLLIY